MTDQATSQSLSPAEGSRGKAAGLMAVMDVLMSLAAAAGTASLCLQEGFYAPLPVDLDALTVIQAAVIGLFALDRLLRVLLHPDRRGFLRENWIDFAVLLAAMLFALLGPTVPFSTLAAVTVYVVITQLYIVGTMVTQIVREHLAAGTARPEWLVAAGLAVAILVGTGLLLLPKAAPKDAPLSVLDALFTMTCATCTTGFAVRDLGEGLTTMGQTIVILFVQLGGLAMTIFGSILALRIGNTLTARASQPLGADDIALPGQIATGPPVALSAGRMALVAVGVTLACELVGTVLLYPLFSGEGRGAGIAIFRSAFHAISAFCGAGLTLQPNSLGDMRDAWQVLGVISPLVILGSLGMPVLYELASWLGRRLRPADPLATPRSLSLHARLVLPATLALIVLGAAGLWATEQFHFTGRTFGAANVSGANQQGAGERLTLAHLSKGEQVEQALAASALRTTGFSVVGMDRLSDAGKFWMCGLMLVGGSPGSAAGGIKTITLAVLLLAAVAALRRRPDVVALRRAIPPEVVRAALAITFVMLALAALTTLLLCMGLNAYRLKTTGQEASFAQCLFEASSAVGGSGQSCNVTAGLNFQGKQIVLGAVFLGRLLPLGLAMALLLRPPRPASSAPAEAVMPG